MATVCGKTGSYTDRRTWTYGPGGAGTPFCSVVTFSCTGTTCQWSTSPGLTGPSVSQTYAPVVPAPYLLSVGKSLIPS